MLAVVVLATVDMLSVLDGSALDGLPSAGECNASCLSRPQIDLVYPCWLIRST